MKEAPKAETETPPAESDVDQTMHQLFIDFNIDRKAPGIAQLVKLFPGQVEETEEKLKNFKCALGNSPGKLHLTTAHICFVGGVLGKKFCYKLTDIKEIAKAKRFKISPGEGHSLHLVIGEDKIELNGFASRDECFAILSEACKAHGT